MRYFRNSGIFFAFSHLCSFFPSQPKNRPHRLFFFEGGGGGGYKKKSYSGVLFSPANEKRAH
jgi:hypothetical protein